MSNELTKLRHPKLKAELRALDTAEVNLLNAFGWNKQPVGWTHSSIQKIPVSRSDAVAATRRYIIRRQLLGK